MGALGFAGMQGKGWAYKHIPGRCSSPALHHRRTGSWAGHGHQPGSGSSTALVCKRRGRVEPQPHAGLALAHIPALVLRTPHTDLHSRLLMLVVAALGAVQLLRLLPQQGEG